MLEDRLGFNLLRASFYGYYKRFAKEKDFFLCKKNIPLTFIKNTYVKELDFFA